MNAKTPGSSTIQPLDATSSGRDESWTTIITPHRGWFDWRLKVLWRYRDLVMLFVWRDFTALYKQTILGPAWHVVQPLATTVTYTLVFGLVAALPTDGVPAFLFYLSGTVVWTYFATTLTQTSATFVANANLLGKVYFHRLSIPISVTISNLISFAIQFGIFVVVLAWNIWSGAPVSVSPYALLSPLLLVMLAGYALGIGIIVAALTTRYRDLAKVVTLGVQLAMFVTPVVYPLSMVPDRFRHFVALNPLTPILEAFRLVFLGVGTVSAEGLIASGAGMVAVLILGLMLFTRIERTFMDTV